MILGTVYDSSRVAVRLEETRARSIATDEILSGSEKVAVARFLGAANCSSEVALTKEAALRLAKLLLEAAERM